jgi:hypothetical protein
MTYIALQCRDEQTHFRLGERDGLQRAWVEVNQKQLPEFVLEHGPVEAFHIMFEQNTATP